MARARILVIDDEYGVRSGIRQILELEGYGVDTASTGREALDLLERQAYHLALIDYQLPDLDGLTLLQAIRTRNADTMTCMITAYANIDMAIAATRQGIDFFLPKPFSPDDLLGVIETLLRHRDLKEEAARLRREHEASLAALATEQSQTRSLVASLRDAVLVVNREGVLALVNPAMAALLRADAATLVHRPADEVLAGEALAPLREVLAAGEGDRRVRQVDLGDRSYMASLSTFQDDGGVALGRVLTLSDLTDVQRMATEKARFVRTMVHEFRSPLGAIRSQLEVCLDRSLGDGIDAYVPFLERASRRIDGMVELIGDLLSLSRIDAGPRTEPVAGSTEVAPLVADLLEQYRERLAAREVQAEVALDPAVPTLGLEADDLRAVLANLLTNAIKYNRQGGRVTVRTRRADGWQRLEVEDTGLGIRPENQAKVFEEFFREKRLETRDLEGNGLGLAIARRLVERAGGRIELRSEEGRGSCFAVVLPG